MNTPTQEDINKAIHDCFWRKDICGVDICAGNCCPCALEIERGRCDTLRRLFAEFQKKGDNNAEIH